MVPTLDAYVVLTHADAADYRRGIADCQHTRIGTIHNALPWPVAATPAPLRAKVVVAAGRLAREGFDRLVNAFAPIARDHPDWQLHIHGEGPERTALTALVHTAALDDQVRLSGYTADLRRTLSRASVHAMSSRAEGFPMVLIESMSVGLPVVAFDCQGPHDAHRYAADAVLDQWLGLLSDLDV